MAERGGNTPRVFLVGAGPGDPGLLTVRAAELLAAADVVFHDALVPGAILAVAPSAEMVPVGRRAGQERRETAGVADAMAARAAAGEVVVRLKGGDPYLFGRGGEEGAALLERGVAFEVVPGVSSALAAPAAAGIPLTHRGVASSVTIVTGHVADAAGDVRWERLAGGADTLVVLMGGARLRQLSRALVLAGRPASTPAAVVMAATRPEQRHVVATLETIADAAEHAAMGTPAVLVVGEVVRLSEVLLSAAVADLAEASAG
ncbi:MAG: uroporphyrin-III C-methyltransferase [Chloroflexota bacterium]|jgi:uroporphyrin-III C-methyltransferase|nr:uroporphyrin-III C-methyltransferase [Chloroflexota bacterium]